MAWLNIAAILMLRKPAFACLADYEAQKALGVDPVFNPHTLGIEDAEYWEKRLEAKESLE